MTNEFFRNNYISLDFYYKGILLGIGIDDEIISIIFPFFIIHIKTWAFKSRPKIKTKK
jgi:hypothetical protein